MFARYTIGLLMLLGACAGPDGSDGVEGRFALAADDLARADDEGAAHDFMVTRVEAGIAVVKAAHLGTTVCGNGMAAAECRVAHLDFSATTLSPTQIEAFRRQFFAAGAQVRGELVQPSSALDAPDTLLIEQSALPAIPR